MTHCHKTVYMPPLGLEASSNRTIYQHQYMFGYSLGLTYKIYMFWFITAKATVEIFGLTGHFK